MKFYEQEQKCVQTMIDFNNSFAKLLDAFLQRQEQFAISTMAVREDDNGVWSALTEVAEATLEEQIVLGHILYEKIQNESNKLKELLDDFFPFS